MVAEHRYADRESWLRHRRIGSSDVPALLGLSRYSGPWDVYERLVLGAPASEPSPEQLRGIRLEPRVLATYARKTGRDVQRTPPHTLYSREQWATSTPDARSGDLLVEAKTDRHADRWGPDGERISRWEPDAARIVRPDYYLQVQHQLWTLEADAADLAVLVPGDDPFLPELRVYRIDRDDELLGRLVPRLRAWWDRHIVGREPPELDGSEAAGRALARLERDGSRPATAHELALATSYEQLAQAEKAARDQKKAAGRLLVAAAGTTRRIELPGGGHVTVVSSVSSAQLDEGALLDDHPELRPLLDRYRRPGHPYAFPRVVPGKGARP